MVFWKVYDTGDYDKRFVLRYSTVFNAIQHLHGVGVWVQTVAARREQGPSAPAHQKGPDDDC